MALMLAFGFGVALGLATMYTLCDLALAEPRCDESDWRRDFCPRPAAPPPRRG